MLYSVCQPTDCSSVSWELSKNWLCPTTERSHKILQIRVVAYQSVQILEHVKAAGIVLTEKQLAAHRKLATVLQHYITDAEVSIAEYVTVGSGIEELLCKNSAAVRAWRLIGPLMCKGTSSR